jgi:hypothetical protein
LIKHNRYTATVEPQPLRRLITLSRRFQGFSIKPFSKRFAVKPFPKRFAVDHATLSGFL